jgi:hypothetical protein
MNTNETVLKRLGGHLPLAFFCFPEEDPCLMRRRKRAGEGTITSALALFNSDRMKKNEKQHSAFFLILDTSYKIPVISHLIFQKQRYEKAA